jgi:15-cis-phytoene synthase
MTVEKSYQYCRQVARARAKNFYLSFLLLRPEQRDAMCAVYTFMRYCDDLSDEPGAQTSPQTMERWRADLRAALAGEYGDYPGWPAFHDTVRRFGIPHEYFEEMIDGVTSDLSPRTFARFPELYRYCYQVASVVGLTIIHIFGYSSTKALELAEKCGIAFQLTNILRDVREDAAMGRVYLPADELARFRVTEEELRRDTPSAAFRELMRFEVNRARSYYDEAAPLLNLVDDQSRSSLWALMEVYSRLLRRIEQSGYDVLSQRVALPTWEKVGILVQARLKRFRKCVDNLPSTKSGSTRIF